MKPPQPITPGPTPQPARLLVRPVRLLLAVVVGLTMGLLVIQLLHFGSSTPSASAKSGKYLHKVSEENQPSKNVILLPSYTTATVLLESIGGNTIELSSALERLSYFSILKEGNKYYLWLSNIKTSSLPRDGIEQRLESPDGLVWSNRTNTDLTLLNDDNYKYLEGLRQVIKVGDTYQGWESYYYEWSLGWAHAVRYVTSTNGINWTLVNQPSQIGAIYQNVIENKGIYHTWVRVDVDNRLYPNEPEIVRYRTSNDGGSGWSDWRTGGTPVTVDGKILGAISYVRQLGDSAPYQLFYLEGNQIHLATSVDGIAFTTQITNILDFAMVLPDFKKLFDFTVVNSGVNDWIYFVYQGQDDVYHIAVSRPDEISPEPNTYTYLPMVLHDYNPPTTFPVHIGNAIPMRGVAYQGEVFYSQSVQIPAELPPTGHFYFSSEQDTVAAIKVDDKLVVLAGGAEVFAYNFSTSGSPQPAVVEVSRSTMEQLVGQTIRVEYRDMYGSVVEASPIWLIWSPG